MMVDLKISVVKFRVWEEALAYQFHQILLCLLQLWNQPSLVTNLMLVYVVKVLVRKEEMFLEKYQEKEINHWLYLCCYPGMEIQELLTTFVLEQQQMIVDSPF